jgi:hypothetical protein
MTTTPSWQPEPGSLAHHRAATDPTYGVIMKALHAHARANPEVEIASVIAALGNVLGDLAASSGVLATSPDLIDSLRALVDELERRRSETHQAAHRLLSQFFANARPPGPAN